ncbi:M6 family metalloprotease domain protein [Anaerohalosphaera lusitana]|uniref:M6 family metalloprotease domain protein n=1 Tax=Anaerohalosphaera lusitana TaxID=1936003 RepID=A0A1U9NNX5_9BACT|nr:hypothetical protein [Anaerohalosphaera lusitana]AQT69545.1 M6 family metalloprotease domain protein [Anaerohalosphaera lusitana]
MYQASSIILFVFNLLLISAGPIRGEQLIVRETIPPVVTSQRVQSTPAATMKCPNGRTVEAHIFFCDTSDAPGDPNLATRQYFENTTRNYIFGTGENGIQSWFDYYSHGKIRFRYVVHPDWLRLPKTQEYYLKPLPGKPKSWNWPEWIADVTDTLLAAGYEHTDTRLPIIINPPNSSKVFMGGGAIHALKVNAPNARFLHLGGGIYLDDSDRYAYLRNEGVVIHEIGHFLGLPDLYNGTRGFNSWDMMGGAYDAAGFCGWHLHCLDWLDKSRKRYVVSTGSKPQTMTLTALSKGEGVFMMVIPDNPAKPEQLRSPWIIELNQPVLEREKNNGGPDKHILLPEATGVLVYRLEPDKNPVLQSYFREIPQDKTKRKPRPDYLNKTLYGPGDIFKNPEAPFKMRVLSIKDKTANIRLIIPKP